jgi:hypothetical protein
MRNGECECRFTSARGSYEEKRASRELAGFDKFDSHPTRLKGHVGESGGYGAQERDAYFASIVLPYETGTVASS